MSEFVWPMTEKNAKISLNSSIKPESLNIKGWIYENGQLGNERAEWKLNWRKKTEKSNADSGLG